MNGDALIQYRGSLIQKASKWKRHMLARLPQRRRQPCQAIGVNGDGLIRMAPATMHLAMTQVNAPPSFFDETPLVASSVWRGARGNARELQVPVRDIIMPLIWVRTWCIKHPHCMRSCAVAMHLRTTARRPGRAVGVCWGLAVLLGTARGCWGLPGVPGMRPLIEFAGGCWGLLVIAQTPVSPPLEECTQPSQLVRDTSREGSSSSE